MFSGATTLSRSPLRALLCVEVGITDRGSCGTVTPVWSPMDAYIQNYKLLALAMLVMSCIRAG